MDSSKIKLCIVNRNYPPQSGASGYFAHQLVSYLKSKTFFDIEVVNVDKRNSPMSVRSFYEGKKKPLRLFSTFLESYFLIKKALNLKSDIYLILTDPPFLNYWAAKLIKNEKWISWTMDIYPEAFAANGLISKSNMFFKHYRSIIRENHPDLFITLGTKQSEYLTELYQGNINTVELPVGLRNKLGSHNYSNRIETKKITFGYVGNIGEAHDINMIYECIAQASNHGHHFVLSCYGSKADQLKRLVTDFRHVFVFDRVKEKDLSNIDIHVVSLFDHWTHISVPSKAISAIEKGGTVLFIGSQESDTWHNIKKAGWCISSSQELRKFISEINLELINKKRAHVEEVYEALVLKRQSGYKLIEEELLRLVQ